MKHILLAALLGLSFSAMADGFVPTSDTSSAMTADAQSVPQDAAVAVPVQDANDAQSTVPAQVVIAQPVQAEKLTVKLDCGDCKVDAEIISLLKAEYAAKAKADAPPVAFTIKKYSSRPTAARIALGTLSGKDEITGIAEYNGKTSLLGDSARSGFCGTECVAKNVSAALANLQN